MFVCICLSVHAFMYVLVYMCLRICACVHMFVYMGIFSAWDFITRII